MTAPALPLLTPAWQAPAGVGAAMTSRAGGVSARPWNTANLGAAVGDAAAAVAENRRRFAAAIGARPVYLRQVHGTRVRRIGAVDADVPTVAGFGGGVGAARHPRSDAGDAGRTDLDDDPADASWTTDRGVACAVLVADCLPVLFATRDGRAVAAAHAGWRGLANGVLEATLLSLADGAGAAAADVVAWLGPCIGPAQFEVGADVLRAFGVDAAADDAAFLRRPRRGTDGAPRWLADLPALAAARLRAAGVAAISADGGCTYGDASRFFSFRRDGVTGRMAAAVWRV